MLYLDKLLTQLASPLALSLGLGLLAWLLLLRGRRRWAAGLLGLALGWLSLWSLPVVSNALRGSLEGQVPYRSADALPPADAILILGGAVQGGRPGYPDPDLGAAADRVWHGARLFHAGKAPRLILSGGRLGWQAERAPEAEAMVRFLKDLGVPESALVLEGRSRNTRENALYSQELVAALGVRRVLLVTSALHMPRALGTFRAVGLDPIPAPTDLEVSTAPPHLMDWLPDAEALAASTRGLKEYLGLWVYRWRGWST